MRFMTWTGLLLVCLCGLVRAFDLPKGIPGVDPRQRSMPPGSAASGAPGQLGHEVPLPTALEYSGRILPDMKGVVSWRTLAQVESVKVKDRFVPQFSDNIAKLDKTEVRLQGFMLPLDMGKTQKRFLLTAVPPSCSFCLPAGADAVVEVRAKSPVKYGFEPMVISGKLSVLNDDPAGLYYRLSDAVTVYQK